MKDDKKWEVKKQALALGYGQMTFPGQMPFDDVDVLLNGITTWGDLTTDADNAIRSCLLYVLHRDLRVRALAITQLGKLFRHANRERTEVTQVVARALSDKESVVREAARRTADLIREASGIEITEKRHDE
jgi:hypothetical protein